VVERRVLKVFNFVSQFPPAAHKFQVSFFYIPVVRFPRSDLAFDRFYPEEFWSRGHECQRATLQRVLPVAYNELFAEPLRRAAVIPRATVILITDRTSKSGPN
jgi:hypothetical protein